MVLLLKDQSLMLLEGCFVSGDGCYGPPSSLPWAMSFPNALSPTRIPVHPTPLYEFCLSFTVFVVMWARRKRAEAVEGDQMSATILCMCGTRAVRKRNMSVWNIVR